MRVIGAEAHSGPAALIYSYRVCSKAGSGSGGTTHAGSDRGVGSHVTNLLGDIQNPVIELNPHLFLQEEGCYKNTAGSYEHYTTSLALYFS